MDDSVVIAVPELNVFLERAELVVFGGYILLRLADFGVCASVVMAIESVGEVVCRHVDIYTDDSVDNK